MSKTTHGLSKTRLYSIFYDMKGRCYNKNDTTYKYYGEKGVKVCSEWLEDQTSFFEWALENGYSDNLTIDRINVEGNYEPSNCRWTTQLQQNCNMRMLSTNTSGYVGISRAKQWKSEYWRAVISINNKTKTIGYSKTKKEALDLRNEFIKNNNLPQKIQEYKND